MRFLAKVSFPKERDDEAFKSGLLPQTIQSAMQRLRPEAAYVFEEEGNRECLFVFNLDVASLLKPLFPNLDASFHVTEVMSVPELLQGLGDTARKVGDLLTAEKVGDLLTDISPGARAKLVEELRRPASEMWPEPLPSRPDPEPTPKPRTRS